MSPKPIVLTTRQAWLIAIPVLAIVLVLCAVRVIDETEAKCSRWHARWDHEPATVANLTRAEAERPAGCE